jgi:voltage-gated potassium channel
MHIIKAITERLRDNRFLRQLKTRLGGSMLFKAFLIGTILFIIFSVAVYYAEKDYVAYSIIDGRRVVNPDLSSNIKTIGDSVWWTFVTSTTVGYGDFYPVSFMGRFVGVLLMFFGVSLVGIITGNIASLLVERQLKEDRGLKDLKLKNHS